jgi:NAD(P)-dependent dehydrogenase (short-subunit alcohol dehydrogenase family)
VTHNTDLFGLDGRVAVVTGGAKGIGMTYSDALAGAGARVAVADIDASAVKETSARLSEHYPGAILPIVLDVTVQTSLGDMVSRIRSEWGRIDILVNNAALFANIPAHISPWEISDDEFDRVMQVNVRSIYTCTRACLPLMEGRGWGRVINVSSGLAFKGAPGGMMHYAASKAAVVNLTRSMAALLSPGGITVNSIAPGNTDSPTVLEARASRAAESGVPSEGDSRARRRYGGLAGAPRIIDRTELPQDLVGTLLYLASPASDFLTGQTIVVDGGTYLH